MDHSKQAAQQRERVRSYIKILQRSLKNANSLLNDLNSRLEELADSDSNRPLHAKEEYPTSSNNPMAEAIPTVRSHHDMRNQ